MRRLVIPKPDLHIMWLSVTSTPSGFEMGRDGSEEVATDLVQKSVPVSYFSTKHQQEKESGVIMEHSVFQCKPRSHKLVQGWSEVLGRIKFLLIGMSVPHLLAQ